MRSRSRIVVPIVVALVLRAVTMASPYQPSSYVISLKSRVFTPTAGFESKLLEQLRTTIPGRRVHVLLQFQSMPSLAQRTLLADSLSIRLLDPLTGPAFFASLPWNVVLARTLVIPTSGQARWIGAVQPADKLMPRLLIGDIPPYARDSAGRAVVTVQFFVDVPVDSQRKVLQQHGLSDSARVELINGWVLAIRRDSILALASHDEVQWITYVAAGPENDNESVRHPLGVNADAVLNNTKYNLSGNGVTVGLWDVSPSSLTHDDFLGRIMLGDELPAWARTQAHDETGTVNPNKRFDPGEGIYRDVDDLNTVSVGDFRTTAISVVTGGTTTTYLAGTKVEAGHKDIGRTLEIFSSGPPSSDQPAERFVELTPSDLIYTHNEPIYRDANNDWIGDAAERISGPADYDTKPLSRIPTSPHGHGTLMAGTIMGSGAGSAGQWKGVAPSALLRLYGVCHEVACARQVGSTGSSWLTSVSDDHKNAASGGATIVAHPWGTNLGHCHQMPLDKACYDELSQLYDEASSGRHTDGTPSAQPRVTVIGSAGNVGYPERHVDNPPANGKFDAGEAIYVDSAGDGTVSENDVLRSGTAASAGTELIDFAANETHSIVAPGDPGSFQSTASIYFDADRSGKVSSGDVLISGAAMSDGSQLREFRRWRNLRVGNSAKNTIQVGAIASDAIFLPSFSSRGPVDDGRMKPDLVAPGARNGGNGLLTSTYTRNRYASDMGTSFSTAAAAGSAALVTEWYRQACGPNAPTPDVLKALLIHAAEDVVVPDAGALPGPDFASGFGRLRVREAVDLLPHHLNRTMLDAGDEDIPLTIARTGRLRVTLVWNDPPRTPNVLPGPNDVLVNDLDLVLIGPDGTQHTPWVLNPALPTEPATRDRFLSGTPVSDQARDRRNPVEQVIVDDAQAGAWIVRVTSTAERLKLAPQSFVVVSEAIPPALGPCATSPASDIWMRDNPTDAGTEPSSGYMWLGPDLWNRTDDDGLAAHENPEFGQPNYLYANVRNAGATTVKAAVLELYLAEAALGLSWPANFTLVGRIFVPNLAPGEVRKVGPLEWTPPAPLNSDHFCMYMRLSSSQNPLTVPEGTSIWNNAQRNNNIAYRNLTIVDLHSSRSLSFQVRNISDQTAPVDVLIRTPSAFLQVGEVRIELSPLLEKRWRAAGQTGISGLTSLRGTRRWADATPIPSPLRSPSPPYRVIATEAVFRGFILQPQEAARMTITFSSANQTTATYNIDVIERISQQIVGGNRYVVRTHAGP